MLSGGARSAMGYSRARRLDMKATLGPDGSGLTASGPVSVRRSASSLAGSSSTSMASSRYKEFSEGILGGH